MCVIYLNQASKRYRSVYWWFVRKSCSWWKSRTSICLYNSSTIQEFEGRWPILVWK